jgi:methionyl-tRNA formyltransferase
MRKLQPDAFVVVAFRILPRELFSIPKFGSLNIHPSFLPKGRGPAPIQWTLLRGEEETGISIIQLTEQIDGGGILMQETAPVHDEECFGDLHDRFAKRGAEMIVEVLDRLEGGEDIRPIQQDDSKATSARKLKPEDYVIDWKESTEDVYNRIRAFSPLPGAVAKLGGEPIKILRVKPYEMSLKDRPGKIVKIKPSIFVETKDGYLELLKVKPSGRGVMSADDFFRGLRNAPEYFDDI